MFGVSVLPLIPLISFHSFFHGFSSADPAPNREDPPWFTGCVNAGSRFDAPGGTRDLDPVTCSARCLDEGYQLAALISEGCCCGNRQQGLASSECFNTSSKSETRDVKRERHSVLCLPAGGGQGLMALYRTEGPFLRSVRLSTSPHRVQAGKTFTVEVSGKLAGRPDQPTGILGLGGHDLSYVTIEIEEMTHKGQSSHHVSVSHDGSFLVPCDWILETPGKYELHVTVSNPLSTIFSTLLLSVSQPSPLSLVVSVLHGPLGVPSCAPFLLSESSNGTVKAVYLGHPVTLQADVGDGPPAQFSWCFTHKEKGENMEGVKTVCLPISDGGNSSVCLQNWTFEKEGVHTVSVNASGLRGWTQETIHIVVVRLAVSDLRGSAAGGQLTSGGDVSVDVEPVTTMRHLLALNLTLTEDNRVSNDGENISDHVSDMNKVQIYAEKHAYPTNTEITFLAVTEVPDPVEFLWHFGDSRSAKTTSRTITKRYYKPGRYDVVVVLTRGPTSLTSGAFPLVVQRAVKLNRLLHQASVLRNQTVTVSCRVNVGTEVSFLWGFGDGSHRPGESTEQHVFHRTGEFTLTVTVSNLVSSASLSSHIFVVDRPCQPPPVKNMGPLRLQVQRHEVISLGVTYESEVDCDISRGLHYTWTLFDSAGQAILLPLTDTHRQSLSLPSHLLLYDTYTATARVQVVGSVVYSNYSVRVQVIPSPPVAFIQGGTNIFINNRNSTVVKLDGQRSYDPDFPMNPLSFSWTCKPVSSITSSCFHRDVHTSSAVLEFPTSLLKENFDQFHFILTVHSSERSTSSETFLTMTSSVIGKVSLHCPQCQGDQVNSDQPFSVSALCEGCDIAPKYIEYIWSLYLINASSRPDIDVPFCYTEDLGAPSTIVEGPSTSPQTPVTSSQNASETRAKKPNLLVTDSGKLSENERKKSAMTEPEPSAISSLLHMETAGSGGEEPFYRPLGEFDPLYSSTEYQPLALDNSGVLHSDHFVQSDVISEFPLDSDSSADWEFTFPVQESGDWGGRLDSDHDFPLMSAEEGNPGISAGRPTGVDGESFSPGDESGFDPFLHEDEGSNLVDFKPSVVVQEPTLLDLPREPVDRGLFESYTYTGISSPSLQIRPFSLRPGTRYMLDVTAKSHHSFLGRTQLFFKTNPAPKGMMCKVQPVRGVELYTHFSIFCTSGKEDLMYEYSISVGGRPPRRLYKGTDFQYFFSLPSGDLDDDYRVTIHTEIRSSMYGTATKPCPVTVRVQPSFLRDTSPTSSGFDPELELWESGLRNLSALVQLGNNAEIRNYLSLLSGILNRLSQDPEANTHVQKRTRHVLICTACEVEIREQESMIDTICILKNLLQVTSQVTFTSVRRMTAHIQVISERFSESSAPGWYHLDQETLNTLVTLLSYSLQAAITNNDCKLEMSNSTGIKQVVESDSHEENIASTSGIPDPTAGVYIERGKPISSRQVMQLVADILQTASDLMLKYILFHKTQEHRVSTGLVALYTTYQNQTSTVIRIGSTTFYLPTSLIQLLFGRGRPHRPCVLSVVTELTHSPYTWARYPGRLNGPVVDLSLYECRKRRKISVRSLIQPINVELHKQPRNKTSACEYVLLRNQVNYHSFNITQEHLQQAIQLSVEFTPPLMKAFPIMLLFRMFERPTPSMHHLQRIHRWGSNITGFTLPTAYLSAGGVAHVALLNADFGKAAVRKHLSEQVSYRLIVDSSLCLSWDDQQGAWTHHGCRTEQADTTTAVTCSCHQLRTLTVVQKQIQSSHDTADLDPFLSVSSDLTVLVVLVMVVCLYIPGWVVCKRADAVSEANCRVHFLLDNSPQDPYLYAVTIHTSPCSAASMSAKVYIVLNGKHGVSQTQELQVPGCSLFRRNSQDTFVFSAAESLGLLWGIHIWHDNSGPSADWYLKKVEVSEVSGGHVKGRAWLFVGRCWLSVNRGDGRVERTLRVCTQGIGFTEMLCLKLSDYFADHHIWLSVHSCPCPNSFTRTQRLGVSLLLMLGYACVSTAIISQMDGQLPFEVGVIDVTAVSVTTGVSSVMAVLPAAAVISFLFRLRELKVTGVRETEKGFFEDAVSVSNSISERHLSWSSFQQWAQEPWRKKYQDADLLSVSTPIQEDTTSEKETAVQTDVVTETQAVKKEEDPQQKRQDGSHQQVAQPGHSYTYYTAGRLKGRSFRPASQWCHYLAWTLCLLLSLSCLVLSAVLGSRFSRSKVLLWIHSLFISLMSCIFLIQPAVILVGAVIVSLWYRNRADFHSFSGEFEVETSKLWSRNYAHQPGGQFPPERCSYFEKLLGARQRARYLRLVRPPTQAELRESRGRKKREVLLRSTLRDLWLCGCMLFLMLCINYGSSFTDHYQLNKAVRQEFVSGGHGNSFMSIQKHEDWWEWVQSSLLDLLYNNDTKSHIIIGEPILWKSEVSGSFQGLVPGVPLVPESLHLLLSGSRSSTHPQSSDLVPMATPPRGHLGCYSGPSAAVGFGCTKSDAVSNLSLLRSGGWVGRQTVAIKVLVTLFSPTPNLFTGVSMLIEQSPTGVLLPSAQVQSVRVYRTPAVWDYVVMVCQLLFLLLSLLQLWTQMYTVWEQGLMGYWRAPSIWLEVSLLAITLVYYIYYIYHTMIILEVVDLLQRPGHRGHVDVSVLATCEQCIRTLHGFMLLLLAMKCVAVLKVNRTLATPATLLTRSLFALFWPTISGLILMVALSCMGNLLFAQSSRSFSSLPRSLQTLLSHYWGLRPVRGLLLFGRDFFYSGVLYLSCSAVWTAVATGVLTSLVRSAKRSHGRGNVITVAELASYIRRRMSDFAGQRRQTRFENHMEGKTYYFEEFESLVDELLFRLNALSNSLHQTLPPKAHIYREDSPVFSSMQEASNVDVQGPFGKQVPSGHGETLPTPHLLPLRSKLETGKWQQHETKAEENTSDRESQCSKAHSCLSLPESAPLSRAWTEDVLEKQADQQTQIKDNTWLSKTQAAHTQVVVEVLVHEELH